MNLAKWKKEYGEALQYTDELKLGGNILSLKQPIYFVDGPMFKLILGFDDHAVILNLSKPTPKAHEEHMVGLAIPARHLADVETSYEPKPEEEPKLARFELGLREPIYETLVQFDLPSEDEKADEAETEQE